MFFAAGPLKVHYTEPEEGFRVTNEAGEEWYAQRVCFEGRVWLYMNDDGMPEIKVNVGAELEPLARP